MTRLEALVFTNYVRRVIYGENSLVSLTRSKVPPNEKPELALRFLSFEDPVSGPSSSAGSRLGLPDQIRAATECPAQA